MLAAIDDTLVDVASLSAIGWRRVNQPQSDITADTTPAEHALISNEWRGFIAGAVPDVFRGAWINEPSRDGAAGNKIIQLRAAVEAGFTIPRTLVSSQPEHGLDFCRQIDGPIIAKKLVGAPPAPLATDVVDQEELADRRSSSAACQTIDQERVPGRRHLRINGFGTRRTPS